MSSTENTLDRVLRLSDLINPEAMGNVCARFADVFKLELTVTDLDGTLIHGPGTSGLATEPDAQKYVRFTSGGQAWLRCRVDNQLEPIGYLFLGPLKPELTDDGVPTGAMSRADVERAVQFLCVVVEEIAYANYTSWMSAKMSLEATRNHLGELIDKEAELARFEETLRDSKELRDLF